MVGFPLVFAASLASSKVTQETLSDVQPWEDAAHTADKRTPNEIFILKNVMAFSWDQSERESTGIKTDNSSLDSNFVFFKISCWLFSNSKLKFSIFSVWKS